MKTIEEFAAFLEKAKAEGGLKPPPREPLVIEYKPEPLVPPVKVGAFCVGRKLFWKEWNAWCYLAKCQLMDELETEVKAANPLLWWGDAEWKAAMREAFQVKYPSSHHHGEHSAFFKATMVRAREIRNAV